jgi:hypothetical protein
MSSMVASVMSPKPVLEALMVVTVFYRIDTKS